MLVLGHIRRIGSKWFGFILGVLVTLSICFILYGHKDVSLRRIDNTEIDRKYVQDAHLLHTEKPMINTIDFGSQPVGKKLEERRRNLMKFCDGKELLKVGNNSESDTKSHFLFDENHKFVYCSVEKIGSTFWKGVFQVIAGVTKESNPYLAYVASYPTFRHLPFDALHAILDLSTKFMITRDPYARLFSGYANKLFQVNPSYWNIGKRVIKHFRKNASDQSLRCGHDATFPEMVKYFIYTETQDTYNRDGHFIPISDHCRPCQIKYDIIAKLETLKHDTIFVLDHLNLTHAPNLRRQMENLENASESDSIRGICGGLIQQLNTSSSCISKSEGLRRTWRSFQFRGYIGKHIKYPLSTEEEETIDGEGLNQMFQTALEKSGKRETRLKNRQLILEEAYSQVSIKDLNTLREIFNNDCGAFGYNCKPEYIFDRSRKPQTNFLDIWNA